MIDCLSITVNTNISLRSIRDYTLRSILEHEKTSSHSFGDDRRLRHSIQPLETHTCPRSSQQHSALKTPFPSSHSLSIGLKKNTANPKQKTHSPTRQKKNQHSPSQAGQNCAAPKSRPRRRTPTRDSSAEGNTRHAGDVRTATSSRRIR